MMHQAIALALLDELKLNTTYTPSEWPDGPGIYITWPIYGFVSLRITMYDEIIFVKTYDRDFIWDVYFSAEYPLCEPTCIQDVIMDVKHILKVPHEYTAANTNVLHESRSLRLPSRLARQKA